MKDLDKEIHIITHTFINPQTGEYTSARAAKQPDNTWQVSTLTGGEHSQGTLLSPSGHDMSGDIAPKASLKEAYVALKKFEEEKFKSGLLTRGFLACMNNGHYSRYKAAIAKKTRIRARNKNNRRYGSASFVEPRADRRRHFAVRTR